MKKNILIAGLVLLLVPVTGCSKSEPVKTEVNIQIADQGKEETEAKEEKEEETVDAKTIADRLKNEIAYKDELNSVDLDTANMFYDFSSIEIDEAYIYESSGATAEEIVVLKCKDADNAKKAKAIFENRLNEQMENYEDYVPEEVVKINAGVIVINGDVAALSVSDEADKAKSILGK